MRGVVIGMFPPSTVMSMKSSRMNIMTFDDRDTMKRMMIDGRRTLVLSPCIVLPRNQRDFRADSPDLQQWMVAWVDWNGESLAILAKVKVRAGGGWVHALVSNTRDRLATTNCVADGTMASIMPFFGEASKS